MWVLGRRLTLALVLVVALAAMAAPAALAAPAVTLTEVCTAGGTGPGISISVSGLAPNQQFTGSITFPSGGTGSQTFTADASGSYGPTVYGAGRGIYHVEVTPDGGATISRDFEVVCASPAYGGSVVADVDTLYSANVPLHLTIDARSGPMQENPSGTVREQFDGHDLTGTVTCVSVAGPLVHVGVTLQNPPSGVDAGQLLLLQAQPGTGGAFQIERRTAGPSPCPLPDGGGGFTARGPIVITPGAPDSDPPEIIAPASAVLYATRPWGTFARYSAVAIDAIDAQPDLDCSPASGARVGNGLHNVSCTATDAAGNTAEKSFLVLVKGAKLQISDLRHVIRSYHLDPALERRLDAPLSGAAVLVQQGYPRIACLRVGDFSRLAAAQSGHGLTQQQAGRVLVDADRLQGALGCAPAPPPATSPRVDIVPACAREEKNDLGFSDFGATFRLRGFPASSTIDLTFTSTVFGTVTTTGRTDSRGRFGPYLLGLDRPVGTITVAAAVERGTAQASASISDPCIAPVGS